MCNLYANERRKHAKLARALQLDLPFDEISETPRQMPGIFPDYVADILRLNRNGKAELGDMRWGFPALDRPGARRPITNVRNTQSGYWRHWLKPEWRCLVPVTAFAEWGAAPSRGNHWFERADGDGFCFAGIWRPWTGVRGTKANPAEGEHRLFAFLTTEPNALVRAAGATAMPVVLRLEDCDAWLTGSVEEALELQRPAPDGALQTTEVELSNLKR